jgi:hypothetical protein
MGRRSPDIRHFDRLETDDPGKVENSMHVANLGKRYVLRSELRSGLKAWRYSGDGRATTTMTKAATMKKSSSKEGQGKASSSRLIDARIKALDDWRGETLARVRALIRQADPDVVEEVKWRKPSNAMLGVPVWEHAGIICTGETYKAVVKLTFARGAALKDPSGIFNSSLEGNVRRAIDIHEGDKINEKALQALIRAAVALNTSKRAAARQVSSQQVRARKRPKRA